MNNYEYFWKTIRIPYPLEKNDMKRKKERSRCNLEREREKDFATLREQISRRPHGGGVN